MRGSITFWLLLAALAFIVYLVWPRIGSSRRAPITAAWADINGGIETALGNYKIDTGQYPKSLQDLFTHPANAANWHGPYLDNAPIDPWKNAYVYQFPGQHNTNGYDLMSTGPDGKAGTEDDINNWTR